MKWMEKTLFNAISKARQETSPLNGWILVTPELATKLLEHNVKNYRVLNHNAAKKYAEDMKAGLWQKNGEPIIFNKDGIEANGQHRLQAVITSGVPVMMYMIFDADVCDIYDLQRKRTCVQVLRAMGYSVSFLIPAVARSIILKGFNHQVKVGDAQICQYVMAHADVMKKAESLIKMRTGKEKLVACKAPCATIAYSLLRTGEATENELADFFKVVNSGKKGSVKREASAGIALHRQIESYQGHSDNLNNRFLEFTYQAFKDFQAGVAVDKNFIYSSESKNAERLIQEVRCMDGMCAMT